MAKLLLIDFDGVLNTYTGNYDENVIPSPRKGVENFLKKLSECYKIEIFTARNKKSVLKWLIENGLDKYIYDVTNVKNPYATVIVDDRALRFAGDSEKAFLEIVNFSPYWK